MAPAVRGQYIAQFRRARVTAFHVGRRRGNYQPAQAGEAAGAPHFYHQLIHAPLPHLLRLQLAFDMVHGSGVAIGPERHLRGDALVRVKPFE
jgi:hypothetical protein